MENQRITDIATHTAVTSIVVGFGLFLFLFDMRTAGSPDDHVFVAEIALSLLFTVAVATGIPAIAMHLRARRQRDH